MKSILFRPEMIRATINGSKTQTRRVIKPQPPSGDGIEIFNWFAPEIKEGKAPEGLWMDDKDGLKFLQKPRYRVGEVVYIGEAYWQDQSGGIWGYKLDGIEWPPSNCGGKSISPLFMPAWAARYFIKILDVRAEFFILADLTPEELAKEGGESALKYLKDIDNKWAWRYEYRLVEGMRWD